MAAAALLGLSGDVVRSAGGYNAVEAKLQLPGGRAGVEADATKQKSDAGESNNNNDWTKAVVPPRHRERSRAHPRQARPGGALGLPRGAGPG